MAFDPAFLLQRIQQGGDLTAAVEPFIDGAAVDAAEVRVHVPRYQRLVFQHAAKLPVQVELGDHAGGGGAQLVELIALTYTAPERLLPFAGEVIQYRSGCPSCMACGGVVDGDRKSTRLNSSHVRISYAVFCLKKKTNRAHNRLLEN